MKGYSAKARVVSIVGLFLLSSCGGGGGGSSAFLPSANFNVGGTIVAAANASVDGDTNDPLARFIDNNNQANPQALIAPVQLNGFVTLNPTGQIGDVFATSSDINDYYIVDLVAGQYVSLRVADFDSANVNAVDIDIELIDASNDNLVAASNSVTEFESVQVPVSGAYKVKVQVFSGTSKYVLSVGSISLAGANHARLAVSADFVPFELIVKYKDSSVIQGISALGFDHVSPTSIQPNEADASALQLIRFGSAQSLALASAEGMLKGEIQLSVDASAVGNTAISLTLQTLKLLKRNKGIAQVEPNYLRYPLLQPNDPFFGFQWHYPNINLPQAWNITTGQPVIGDVIVAVVDTGVVLSHEDLQGGKLVAGFDFIGSPTISRDGDGIDSDPNDPGDSDNLQFASWHGTHVAGTVGASTDNNIGVAGVSWDSKIMPVRVLGFGGGSSFDVLQGVRFAAGLSNVSGQLPAEAADVINLSLGGGGFSQFEQDTFNEVRTAGVIVVAAAGNDGAGIPSFPASYSGVVSVSATDLLNNRASYSNFHSSVDVAAPGGNTAADANGDGFGDGVLSTAMESVDGVNINDTYVFFQGTSMATPHVAGVIALMKAVHPGLTPDDFDAALQNGLITTDLGAPGRDDLFGYGQIDALKAVQHAESLENGVASGAILVSDPRIDYGPLGSNTSINILRVGNTPPIILGVTSDDTAITVSPSSIDANGAGDYSLVLDRGGLSDGFYEAQITVQTSDSNDIFIEATYSVGVLSSGGDAGFLFILALDAVSEDPVAQIDIGSNNGTYVYSFSSLPAGSYRIVAGSDIDNDGFICGVGETCGGFPTLNEISSIDVFNNTSGVDFGAAVVNGVNSNSASYIFSTKGKKLQAPVKRIK